MSKFKTIEKLGLKTIDIGMKEFKPFIYAEDLEAILQSAQVVYGHVKQGKPNYWGPRENGQFDDTHTALIVGITPIKKKTKAEAALEFIRKVADREFTSWPRGSVAEEAKRILEMKDEV